MELHPDIVKHLILVRIRLTLYNRKKEVVNRGIADSFSTSRLFLISTVVRVFLRSSDVLNSSGRGKVLVSDFCKSSFPNGLI